MANEYLKRTPTSTGNRKVWTWSGWVKFGDIDKNDQVLYSAVTGSSYLHVRFMGVDPTTSRSYKLNFQMYDGSTSYNIYTDRVIRDPGSWYHLLVSVDYTQLLEADRTKIYINNELTNQVSQSGSGSPTIAAQNYDTYTNLSGAVNNIGYHSTYGEYSTCNIFDLCLVDGQALTPDVFGFYKDGDGYMSSGTTQATEFRPGQWVPKSPSVIKNVINNSGGFGVNGFYLPMNDSSNNGADFHCDPNSIIKLKGEDLPQPQNGAPTTSDAYVSQLRTDPYAANLVLAVPGISTSTSATLVTNGTFDSGITGWSNWNATLSYDTTTFGSSIKIVDNGGQSRAYQVITTEVGKRYTATADIKVTGGNSRYDGMYLYTDVTDATTNSSGNNGFANSTAGTDNIEFTARISFTATTTTTVVVFTQYSTTATTYVKNVVVKQEDAPRDYSADIKGSGTNKTLTAVGNAGVGYELGGYYGSAMTFDGTGDQITAPSSTDLQLGAGDFTLEAWVNYSSGTGADTPITLDNGTATFAPLIGYLSTNLGQPLFYLSSTGSSWDITGNGGLSFGSNVSVNQWTHLAVVREGTNLSIYRDGVCANILNDLGTKSIYQGTNQISFGRAQNTNLFDGQIQDVRVYKGVAKYKGGFDVPKPYTPVGIESWRTTDDTCKNNFCIMNTLAAGSKYGLLDGNLTFTNSTANWTGFIGSTHGFNTGKWYWEARINVSTAYHVFGIMDNEIKHHDISDAYFYGMTYQSDGRFYGENNGGASFSTGNTTAQTVGDVVMLAVDMDAKKMWLGINGSWLGSGNPSTGANPNWNSSRGFTDGHYYTPAFLSYSSSGMTANFGQNQSFSGTTTAGTNADDSGKGLFKYAPPTGFLALCEDNLPAPAIADPGEHFKTVLYTGDGNNGRGITGVGFQPDLVWIKERTSTSGHIWFDSVRGAGNYLFSVNTSAEGYTGGAVMSFDSDGYSTGNNGATNQSSQTYVAWCWKAGGAAVSNTDGTLASQVSVNQDAGFSIVEFTGQGGSSSATVGHGLGKKPAFWIYKPYTNTSNWYMYHQSLGASAWLTFTTSLASTNNAAAWGGVEPTSTVLTHGAGLVNQGSCILYAWAEIEGYSKFGSYVGNGSADGPFAYCGFKPAWVLIKKTNGSGNEHWRLFDSSRCPTNQNNKQLLPSASSTEQTETGMDFVSNGFKLRDADAHQNQSGSTYIFAAFAESPFQTANAK